MSTHNICFCGEIRNISILVLQNKKSALFSALGFLRTFELDHRKPT